MLGMQKTRHFGKLFWVLPFLFHSNHAHAWGLMTHLYFAHSLLWAMPLLDPRLQAVIKKFPDLVMAGACLPDLAIVSPAFNNTHDWELVDQMLASAKSDEEMAIAIGYASHLYVDVLAHNHFVPAHEAMWFENTMATHIGSEWAMDAHLTALLHTSPGKLLRQHRKLLCEFVKPRFHCTVERAFHAIDKLAFWDTVLRAFKIPHLIYVSMRAMDSRVHQNFVYYIAKTQHAMFDIGVVLNGTRPHWDAEQKNMTSEQLRLWRKQCLGHLDKLHPTPIPYFSQTT